MPDKPLFPTGLVPYLGAQMPDNYHSIRSGDDCQSIISIRRWDTPKIRGGKLKFQLTATELLTLKAFWASVAGSYTPFDFVFPWPDVWFGLYVGIGDGITDVFDLPGLATSARACYKDGVAGTPSYTTDTGENDRDRCDFVTAPVSGALVTCDFTGKRVIVAVMNDELDVIDKGVGCYVVTVSLDEV